MTRRKQAVHELSEQAEELFLSLTGPDATPEDWDRHEYLAETSSEYRKIFARCESVWQGLDDIGESRLSNLANPGHPATTDMGGRIESRRWSSVYASLTVLALIAVGVGAYYLAASAPDVLTYSTQTREHRDIALQDGSSLVLGARSSVHVRYTQSVRLIELESGELLATVFHDDGRPFILVTDDMMVMATGTAFNVRNGSEYSTVSVVQGTVRVVPQAEPENTVQSRRDQPIPEAMIFDSGALLGRGQQLRAAKNTDLGASKDVDIEQVVSWQSGQLYFLEDDLSAVLEGVMRYSDVTFMLTDQSIGERIYTGSFRPDSLDAWLDAMERAYSLKVTRIGNGWIAIAPDG